jgi:hypothetical protein
MSSQDVLLISLVIVFLSIIGGGVAVAITAIRAGQRPLEAAFAGMTSALLSFAENEELISELEKKFDSLPEPTQSVLSTIIEVLSPWTEMTATDLDDKVIAALKDIVDGIEAQRGEKPAA